jgi:xylulokinase
VSLNLSVVLDLYKSQYPVDKITIIGGCADDTWSQICADVYNVKCNKINYEREATSIGAAVAAGVGVGMFKDFTAVNKFIEVTKTFYPNTKNAMKYQKMKPIFDEAYHSLIKVYSQLANL